MSSKVTENSETDSELIQCKNCHQDILKNKMFLHEGFCIRNNVYCGHCEKVFLKKDYEDHVKLIQKNNNQKDNDSSPHSQKSKDDTQSDTLKPSSFTEETENISNNVITLIPKPSLEIVQMPVTEMLKINAPIFVSENGQIVSEENKNEYLLPLLGINFRSSKINEKILDDIIDKGDIFKENNNINQNNTEFQDIKNLINNNEIDSNNNNTYENFNNTININSRKNLKLSNYSVQSMTLNNKSNSTKKNFNLVIQEINNTNDPSFRKYSSTLNSIEENKKEEKKPLDNDKIHNDLNNDFFYNKVTTKHSQRIINKKYNFLTRQETPQKTPKNNINNRSIKKIKNSVIPHDSNNKNKNSIKKLSQNNKYQSYKKEKEPKDSNSKNTRNRNSFKFYQISSKKNISSVYESANDKLSEDYDIIRCEYCNNLFTPSKFISHHQKCKYKKKIMNRKLDIPKPKKKKEIIKENKEEKEEFIFEDDEEGINQKNRETLKRKFNASLNVISLNCDSGYLSNTQQIYSKEQKTISLKKKLFHNTCINFEKRDKKIFPEDTFKEDIENNRGSKIFKKISNLNLEGNNSINYNLSMNGSRSPENTFAKRYIPCGKIEPRLYFNNDKVVVRYPQDKKSLRNSKV